MHQVLKQIKSAVLLLVFFTILTGLIYPLIVTAIAQIIFPWQANGSFIANNGHPVGSTLIGQNFTSPNYFWSRPSATTPFPYNAANSSGSNLGPSNPDLIANVKNRIAAIRMSDSANKNLIPIDLVTASASGLDPEISPQAAFYQIPRIAKARGMTETKIEEIVNHTLLKRTLCIFGEPRVNVLALNLALDGLEITHITHLDK